MTKEVMISFAKELMSWDWKGYNLEELGWGLTLTNQTRALGKCTWNNSTGFKEIGLSKHLHKCTDKEIYLTIIHEITHAVDVEIRGTSAHDYVWKSLNLEFGGDGQRCANFSLPVELKYYFYCKNCYTKIPKTRKSKYRCSCAKCSPTPGFDERYELEFKLNENYEKI